MRCRKDDIAVIVFSEAGNEGKIVRCLQFKVVSVHVRSGPRDLDAWLVDRELPAWDGRTTHWVPDSYLRPIRDGEGDDETLTWAGKPTEDQDRLWAEFDSAMSERR